MTDQKRFSQKISKSWNANPDTPVSGPLESYATMHVCMQAGMNE